MSSKAYQEASKKETDKCRIAITNLYMAGINHDGHSWNTFGDIEDCLEVVIEEMYMQGARKFAKWCIQNNIDFSHCEDSDCDNCTRTICRNAQTYTDVVLAEWQKGVENEI